MGDRIYRTAKNQRRTDACLWACAGIPTAALEADVVQRMREHLQNIEARLSDQVLSEDDISGAQNAFFIAMCKPIRALLAELQDDAAAVSDSKTGV